MKKKFRTIVVNNRDYTYLIARGDIVIKNDAGKKHILDISTITGLSHDEIERGQWKGWFHITPSLIEKCIKDHNI